MYTNHIYPMQVMQHQSYSGEHIPIFWELILLLQGMTIPPSLATFDLQLP